jgi:hypothetical protein
MKLQTSLLCKFFQSHHFFNNLNTKICLYLKNERTVFRWFFQPFDKITQMIWFLKAMKWVQLLLFGKFFLTLDGLRTNFKLLPVVFSGVHRTNFTASYYKMVYPNDTNDIPLKRSQQGVVFFSNHFH